MNDWGKPEWGKMHEMKSPVLKELAEKQGLEVQVIYPMSMDEESKPMPSRAGKLLGTLLGVFMFSTAAWMAHPHWLFWPLAILAGANFLVLCKEAIWG
jgi:hypothetical protein